jgi:hypothetical protein
MISVFVVVLFTVEKACLAILWKEKPTLLAFSWLELINDERRQYCFP